MQSLVAAGEVLSATELLERMLRVSAQRGWPQRVYDADSVEVPGSEMWCKGYIVGSRWAKNRYFEDA
jgi:hypothetical protein